MRKVTEALQPGCRMDSERTGSHSAAWGFPSAGERGETHGRRAEPHVLTSTMHWGSQHVLSAYHAKGDQQRPWPLIPHHLLLVTVLTWTELNAHVFSTSFKADDLGPFPALPSSAKWCWPTYFIGCLSCKVGIEKSQSCEVIERLKWQNVFKSLAQFLPHREHPVNGSCYDQHHQHFNKWGFSWLIHHSFSKYWLTAHPMCQAPWERLEYSSEKCEAQTSTTRVG